MVMVLEQEVVEEIARLGHLRSPNEACGILLPVPHKGKSVYELPNRSHEPADSFELWGSDILLQLEALTLDQGFTAFDVEEITVWHTHPQGNTGPSRADMDNKPDHFKHLVVAIASDSTGTRSAVATWF